MSTVQASHHEDAPQSSLVLQALLARSTTDPAFRSKLISAPRAAVAEFYGKSVSAIADANVVFVENTADATIVLPPFIDTEAELSEHDLETVNGGSELVTITMSIIASAVATHQAGWW